MRSSLPKPLHPPLRAADAAAHPRRPVGAATSTGPWWSSGRGAERIIKTLQEHGPPDLVIDDVEQHSPRGTGDALSVALTAFPDDDMDDGDIVVLPSDSPLVRPGHARAPRRRAPGAGRRRHPAHRPAVRPHRHGQDRPGQGRQGGPHRRGARRHRGRAGHRRGRHLDLLLPAEPAGPCPAPDQPRQRQGRVLPHRRGGGAPRRRAQGDLGAGRRPVGGDRGQRHGPSWRAPRPSCAGASTSGGCRPASG